MQSKSVKKYERHILYKILIILVNKNKQNAQKYMLFKEADFDGISSEGGQNQQIYLFSFLTVHTISIL